MSKLKSNPSFQAIELGNLKNEPFNSNIPASKDKHKKLGVNFFNLIKTSSKPTALKILEKRSDETLNEQVLKNFAEEENFNYNLFDLGTNKSGNILKLHLK